MYKTIKGIFENGQITLEETPPTIEKSDVYVMFMEKFEEKTIKKGVHLGSLANKGYNIPDDFNASI